jgi:hypothetical protein
VERPAFPAVHVANAAWKELSSPKPVQRVMEFVP